MNDRQRPWGATRPAGFTGPVGAGYAAVELDPATQTTRYLDDHPGGDVVGAATGRRFHRRVRRPGPVGGPAHLDRGLPGHALQERRLPAIAEKGVPALERSRLSHAFQNYFRPETLGFANMPLVARQAGLPLAQA